MKKWDWIVGAVGILLLFITGFGCIFYFASKENDKTIILEETYYHQAETENASTTKERSDIYANGKAKMQKESFYLVYSDNRLCIYRGDDKIFYDYADVQMNLMPTEICEQLKYGLYIEGEQELYEFLQTYSS